MTTTFFLRTAAAAAALAASLSLPAQALAQMAGIAGASKKGFLLSAIRDMKFPSPARPGEKILLQAKKSGALGGLVQFSVSADVDGRIVAEGRVVLNEL